MRCDICGKDCKKVFKIKTERGNIFKVCIDCMALRLEDIEKLIMSDNEEDEEGVINNEIIIKRGPTQTV